MHNDSCPDLDLLRRSVDPDDWLTEQDRRRITEHIARCHKGCKQAITDLLRGNTVLMAQQRTITGDNTNKPASAASDRTEPGVVVVSRPRFAQMPGYEILEEIGRGGMGVVYKARQVSLNRLVALKMLLDGEHAGTENLVRTRREAAAVAQLQHPNIVQIHEVGEHNGRPYLALEFIAGGTLSQRLAGTPQSAPVAVEMLESLARAMHAAHLRGIIHRDLKPANILVTTDGMLKITDFGLAKRLEARATQTQSGVIMGTPSYMAPEQALGKSVAIGPATDVYALGAVLYEMLTGRPPFMAASALDILALVVAEEPVPPSRLQPKVPRDVETICLKCLQKEPGKRYASALALADDLHRFALGESIHARPVGVVGRTWRWSRRNPRVAGLLTILAVVIVGSLASLTALWRQAERAAAAAQKANTDRAFSQVEQLRSADAGAVPEILNSLKPFQADILPRLRQLWAQEEPAGKRQLRMRVGLALLASEPNTVKEELFAWMLDTDDPRELELARDALAPQGDTLKDRLWALIDDPNTAPTVRFHALVGLARFDPGNSRWQEAAPATLEAWLRADPLFFPVLTRALAPVSTQLIGPLTEVAKGQRESLVDKRYEAAAALAVYAEKEPETLVDLLVEADERQFALLFPRVQAHHDRSLLLLRQELEGGPLWFKPPLPDSERDHVASRQANAAIALLRLKQEDLVWRLLEHNPDPTRRTYLVLRMATRGVPSSVLVDRLAGEPEVSERRALLSALGQYQASQMPADLRQRLVPRLLTWYRDHPDPGLHASIDWLLRPTMDGPRPRLLDWGEAQALADIDAERRGQEPQGRNWSINRQGQTMVHFKGPVEFWMGSPIWETNHVGDDVLHRCRIERSFAIASKKITVRDFEAFRKAYPEQKVYGPDPNCPVLALSWYDAAMYCRWLSEMEDFKEEDMCYPSIAEIEKCKDGQTPLTLPAKYLSRKGYRLPTEAEWEYACRGDTLTAHWYGGGGEDLLAVHAWYQGNSRNRSWPVGQKRPNDFGMFDMHGNAWDWCQGIPRPYQVGTKGYVVDVEDDTDVSDRNNRALRGGSFYHQASIVRSAYRDLNRPSYHGRSLGVRVARTL